MQARKKKKLKQLTSAFLVIAIGIYCILYAFSDSIVFFYTPSELNKASVGKEIKIGGLVQKDSVKRITENSYIFTLTDYKTSILIEYSGFLPTLFREGQGVVAKGILSEDKNILIASQLLIKHDEKYKPPSKE
ncbi:MAG: cytochrome c maturation protein CcmE [Rickettsiaceae bacterium]|nr:cytochrome c maturation protein CcmE [Rickettsiaceae bacterium]